MIVAITGHVEEEYIKKAWTHEIDEVIAKPVNPVVLKDLLMTLTWMQGQKLQNYPISLNKLNNWIIME